MPARRARADTDAAIHRRARRTMSAANGSSVFDEAVTALEPTFKSVAPFILTRLLLRARIFDRATMSAADLARALPVVEAGLAESLTAAELTSNVSRIKAVLERRQGAHDLSKAR